MPSGCIWSNNNWMTTKIVADKIVPKRCVTNRDHNRSFLPSFIKKKIGARIYEETDRQTDKIEKGRLRVLWIFNVSSQTTNFRRMPCRWVEDRASSVESTLPCTLTQQVQNWWTFCRQTFLSLFGDKADPRHQKRNAGAVYNRGTRLMGHHSSSRRLLTRVFGLDYLQKRKCRQFIVYARSV